MIRSLAATTVQAGPASGNMRLKATDAQWATYSREQHATGTLRVHEVNLGSPACGAQILVPPSRS